MTNTKDIQAYLHITGHSGISVYPPGSADSCLTVEYSKLVKAEDLLQTTTHSNTTLPRANDGNRVICIAPWIVPIVLVYRIPIHLVDLPISALHERKIERRDDRERKSQAYNSWSII
jgi:hypothetical protein